jgi:hypothetical protein
MQMNDKEIAQFLNALKDFMKHSEMEEHNFYQRSEYKKYQEKSKMAIKHEIEKKAAELEVTVDYYIQEFM